MATKRLAARVSPQELWDILQNKIKEKFGDDGAGLFEIVRDIDKIGKDISKVRFDLENSCFLTSDSSSNRKFGPMQIGDFSFIGCMAGGDWEFPIYFVIYLDKDKKTLRGYVPGDGNPWNHDTKMAFGNDTVADSNFLKKWIKKNRPDLVDPDREYETDDADVMYNPQVIEKDIATRIHVI